MKWHAGIKEVVTQAQAAVTEPLSYDGR